MHARTATISPGESNLPYRIRDVAMDIGLLMIAATFALLGGAGLVAHLLGVAYPLSGLMVADAALTGFLAGLSVLGWLFTAPRLRLAAALPLVAITLYTLTHNAWAGGPWQGSSWVTGGPRILSVAALLLLLVALCSLAGLGSRMRRLLWAGSGVLALLTGALSLAMLLLPASRTDWSAGFVSAPMLATLYALLGGVALLGVAWRGPRPMLPVGRLTQVAAVAGVLTSCLAWYVLTWNAQTTIHRQAATLLDNVELNARRVMTAQLELYQRLAWRQGQEPALRADRLRAHDVDSYFRHAPYLEALVLIGPRGGIADLRAPRLLDPRRLRHEIMRAEVGDWLALPWQAPHAMPAPDAPSRLLIAAPVDNEGRQLVARLDLAQLLAQELGVQLQRFRVEVCTSRPLLELRQPGRLPPPETTRPLPHLGTRQIGLPGGARLTLEVHLDSLPAMLRAGLMPGGFAISGLILSYLLALSLGLVRLVLGRSRELLAARRRLEAQYDLEQRFRSLYLYHPDGVFSLDHEGRLVSANAACSEITGRRDEEVLGEHFSVLLAPEDIPRLQALFKATLAGEPGRVELTLTHRDGELRALDLTTLPIIVEGETQGVFGIAKDITRQREHEAQIAYQASHDLLTALPNRSLLDERLAAAFLDLQESSQPLLVMLLDLDGFKAVNDGLGHAVGNALLVAVAERLRGLVAPGDTIARLAGDEFCLLLPGRRREAGAHLAGRLLDALSRPYYLEGNAVHISASIGIATSDGEIGHAQELLQHADLAVSGAKQQGRNTWQWYRGDGQRITAEEVLLRHDLYTALNNEEFVLHYQPIVAADDGSVRGFEALIRWHHPQRGLISPGVFIPLAEQTGQIIPLGRWVLRQACQEMAELQAYDGRALPVAVNISSLQFHRDGFLDEVRHILATTGLPPELLELEVTESVLLDGAEPVIELMETLKAMGVRVALDDFGTGFSSLSYLRDLSTHKVKLDRSFVQKTLTDRRTAAIVQGVITMAHHMDMVVVAEGIETPEEQEDMVRRECDLLQGFLFARPLPLAALRQLPDCLPEPHS